MSGAITKVGRPVVLTDRVVDILDAAFRRGLSVTEATIIAGIHRDTYYSHLAKNEQFAYRMERAKSWLNTASRLVIYNSIVIDQNPKTAMWYLSHCDPDFGARVHCRFCGHRLRTG
jgi:hypothetical protein